ncbi:MAG: ABC transporter substrate-binding protein [Xanthobacteraceae bacterium]
MQRREFIKGIAVSSVWPLAAQAQQRPMPVIGFLNSRAPGNLPKLLAAFRQGLNDTGYIEGQNVAIEYRFAENQYERLPALAADLVRHQVSVIAATGSPAALAAMRATPIIPIVFETSGDPIKLGLVANLNRPGGNVTGVTQLVQEVEPKLLELLHELLPSIRIVALLVNPADPTLAEANRSAVLAAAHNLGLELQILNASSEHDFDGVFKKLTELRAGALMIGGDALFTAHSEQLAALAVRHGVPAFYKGREFAAAGGLIAYGSEIADSYRLVGNYTGRVLNGEKPADLPVQRATKIQLIINFKTAKALGITIPLPVSGRADEVIE